MDTKMFNTSFCKLVKYWSDSILARMGRVGCFNMYCRIITFFFAFLHGLICNVLPQHNCLHDNDTPQIVKIFGTCEHMADWLHFSPVGLLPPPPPPVALALQS